MSTSFIRGSINRLRDEVISATEQRLSILSQVQLIQRLDFGSEFIKLEKPEVWPQIFNV